MTETTVVFEMTDVRESTADQITEGLVEQRGDEVIAEVVEVDVEPATIIVEAEDGSLGIHDHPELRDVTFVVEMQVRDAPEALRFKGQPVYHGATVTFDFRRVTLEADVQSVD